MVNAASSVPFADLFRLPSPSRPRGATPEDNPFVQELLCLLHESMNGLGRKATAVEVVPEATGTQNSSPRRFLVTFASADAKSQAPAVVEPATYVPFDKGVAAWDIERINSQQSARNAAFRDWVGWITSNLERMGHNPEVTFNQSPDSLYICPVTAMVRLPDIDPDFEAALTLYHYDAWREIDPAPIVLQQLSRPECA